MWPEAYRASAGVPRQINRICDRALHHAYVACSWRIEPAFVAEAIVDLGLAVPADPVATAAEAASVVRRKSAPAERAAARTRRPLARAATWLTAAAAMLLAVSGGIGGTFWYARVQALDRDVAIPAPPPAALTIPQLPLPPPLDPIAAEDGAPAADAQPEHAGDFSILVASFTNPTRAWSLVDELTKAGFRARSVERDWGPSRSRLIQVNVEGYASAIEVQRDLQRIRELPGGYEDARIVERQ